MNRLTVLLLLVLTTQLANADLSLCEKGTDRTNRCVVSQVVSPSNAPSEILKIMTYTFFVDVRPNQTSEFDLDGHQVRMRFSCYPNQPELTEFPDYTPFFDVSVDGGQSKSLTMADSPPFIPTVSKSIDKTWSIECSNLGIQFAGGKKLKP